MKGSTDVVKGRIEEAAGVLAGKEKWRAKGRMDQAVGHAEQAAEASIRQAEQAARKIVDDAKKVAQEAIDKVKGGDNRSPGG